MILGMALFGCGFVRGRKMPARRPRGWSRADARAAPAPAGSDTWRATLPIDIREGSLRQDDIEGGFRLQPADLVVSLRVFVRDGKPGSFARLWRDRLA